MGLPGAGATHNRRRALWPKKSCKLPLLRKIRANERLVKSYQLLRLLDNPQPCSKPHYLIFISYPHPSITSRIPCYFESYTCDAEDQELRARMAEPPSPRPQIVLPRPRREYAAGPCPFQEDEARPEKDNCTSWNRGVRSCWQANTMGRPGDPQGQLGLQKRREPAQEGGYGLFL